MLFKILAYLAKWKFGQKILGWIEKGNKLLSGSRSEILLSVWALLYTLEKLGILPEGLYESSKPLIYGALPVTLAEKVKKVMGYVDKAIPNK